MKIKCWGTRGSLPTPGTDTLKYGGNTTCFQIDGDDGTLIVIDAGTGMRALGSQLVRKDKRREIHLLITHAHWDHLMGFPFFVPANRPDYHLRIYGNPGGSYSLKKIIAHQLEAPFFPLVFQELKAKMTFTDRFLKKFNLGAIEVSMIPLSHPNGGVGYKFTEKGQSMVFLTDNELAYRHPGGLATKEYTGFCANADLLIHDAQYATPEYNKHFKRWGHSTFDQVIQLSLKAKVKRVGFCHHAPDRSDEALDLVAENYHQNYPELNSFVVNESDVYMV